MCVSFSARGADAETGLSCLHYFLCVAGILGRESQKGVFVFLVFKSHFSGCRSLIGPYIVYNVKTVFLQLCTDALKNGWTKFKVKVGADLEDDIRRCRLVRQMIGPDNTLVWLLLHRCSIYVMKNKTTKPFHFVVLCVR